MALFGRELGDEKAMEGALHLSDGIDCLRVVRAFLIQSGKRGGKRG